MATAVFRPNTHSMHMLPLMTGPASTHHMHQQYQQQYQQQQQQQHQQIQQHHHQHQVATAASTTKRPIAPASAQHPRTIAPLHPANGQQNIAPATTAAAIQPKLKSTAAKLPFHPHAISPYPPQPASVQRRNARERNRVKQVNNGFANLRQHIPGDVITALSDGAVGRGASKKLSKVDTLKLAVEYIRRLQELIDETDAEGGMPHGSVQSVDSNDSALSTSSSSLSSTDSYYSTSPPATSASTTLVDSHGRSAASPAPSFLSDVSSSHQSAYTMHSSSTTAPLAPATAGHHAHPHPPTAAAEYKYEPYDAYNADDEELLDCISWWQQQ